MNDLTQQGASSQVTTQRLRQNNSTKKFESLIKNGKSYIYCPRNSALKLLAQYPTAVRLARARAKTVAKIPYINPERASQLIENAKKSVASSCDTFTEQLITTTVEHILQLDKSVKNQVKILATNCSIPEVELLKSFTGIGDYSAIGLMLEIQTITRFPTAKKLASFFGVHPMFKNSGDGTTVARMSKKGRSEPRRILFMVVMSAINSNPLIQDVYKKHVDNNKKKLAAIGACMHKVLRIIYGMLKNQTAFDPAIDKRNQTRTAEAFPKEKKDENRRFQELDPQAPVSRRQSKKRKEQMMSQNALQDVQCGINPPAPVSS